MLSASGDVLNPEIIRIMPDGSSTQKMKLLTSMKAGDRIRISTISGQKRVEKWSDDRQKWLNIFNTLTMDSTFIQLDVGENYLRSTAATHSDQLEIKVQYESRYVGV
ncbi:phage tail domain-containing protein [Carnobacterium maltaromaticum]|uniref:phage distal tail protein n=1 Tax=Carnobacterium maltaromaticum TaxID=2751 RepID=UPI0022774BBE|nr:phage tail domain-containing protein [Carnobacterium maltaromaticum]